MNTPYTPTEADIAGAWPSASARYGYPPVRENVSITLELHPKWKSFVRMGAIPERFHEAIRQLSQGSTCPFLDERRDTFYTHDVYRWLRALGVEATFLEP
jgi:hypothetical protein